MILFLVDMSGLLQVALSATVLATLYRTITLHALRRSRDAVVALQLTGDGELLLRRQSQHSWHSATIENRFVHRKLVLLRTRRGGRRITDTVLVAADALNQEAFRRLRATLLAPPRTQGA